MLRNDGVDLVEVGPQDEVGGVGGGEPGGQRFGRAGHEGQHGLASEGAVREHAVFGWRPYSKNCGAITCPSDDTVAAPPV
jgi:hypothetical protein